MSKIAAKPADPETIPLCRLRGAVLLKSVARKATTCRVCEKDIAPGDEVWRVLIENYKDSGVTRGNRYCRAHFTGGVRYA